MKTRPELLQDLADLRLHWTEIDNRIFAEAHNGQSPQLTGLIRYQHKVTEDINFVRLQLLAHDHANYQHVQSNPSTHEQSLHH
jgi:hypothetical protein